MITAKLFDHLLNQLVVVRDVTPYQEWGSTSIVPPEGVEKIISDRIVTQIDNEVERVWLSGTTKSE